MRTLLHMADVVADYTLGTLIVVFHMIAAERVARQEARALS